MASNTGTNAAYTSTNIKPDPDEQLDAIWGQNIADNTAYLYYRSIQLPIISGAPVQIRGFRKDPAHNCLRLQGYSTTTGTANQTVRIFKSGTNTSSTPEISTTVSVPPVAYGQNVYNVDISSLTNGSYYDVAYQEVQDVLWCAHLLHGSLATY